MGTIKNLPKKLKEVCQNTFCWYTSVQQKKDIRLNKLFLLIKNCLKEIISKEFFSPKIFWVKKDETKKIMSQKSFCQDFFG